MENILMHYGEPMTRRRLLGIYTKNIQRLIKMQSFPLTEEGVVFNCELSMRKRHNLALEEINKFLLHEREVSMPHILHVGVSSRCNLRCPACPTGVKQLGRPSVDLDYDLYARTVEQLRGSALLMLFWDWGEPFLHSRLIDMIALAKKSHIRCLIATNGTVKYPQKKIDALVALQPDLIIICIDGATQETYEKYRIGGRLSSALTTLHRIMQAKEKLGTPYPAVEFRTVASQHNEHDIPQLLQMAEESGATVYSLKSMRPNDARGHDLDSQVAPHDPKLARYAYADGTRTSPDSKGPLKCGLPMYSPSLQAGGDLVFCCFAQHDDEKSGSLSHADFRSVWRSKEARNKRLSFLVNGGTQTCQNCYFRSNHSPSIKHSVLLRPMPPGLSLVQPTPREKFLAYLSDRDI